METGKGVDVIYTDFSKAFDTVETGVLLHELKECGVRGKLGCWIASFLDSSARQQAVTVDGRISPLKPVISGVPQGTVLGPVLFLIHIRNISKDLSASTTASSFADDTRVQRGITSAADCSDLQADLQLIYDWATKVNMKFNSEKFECVRYWSKQADAPAFQYTAPDNKQIEVKSNLRDLGVQLCSSLNFNIHIENTITAASKLVGWGLRTFRGRGRRVMITLLKSLVQPKLDYCSQLWSPSDQLSINKLESVQHNLVDRIRDYRLAGLSYWEKLQELRLYSQERRRERYQVIFLWKISQGMVSGYDVQFTSLGIRRGRSIVPNPIVQSAPAMVRKAREQSLGVRGAQLFNLLPEKLRRMNTEHVDTFKNHLDVFLSSIPDQPTVTGLGRAALTNSLLHQLPLFYNLTN
jgi:ribonuclease P/MRP protein subunit RPP40